MHTNEDKILKYLESLSNKNLPEFENNLKELISLYKQNSKRLNVIIKQSDNQQKRLLELNEELDLYKNHLEIKVEEEIQKRKEKETMLLEQSKLAAMGEMIDAVAHQWKQPLNTISLRVGMIGYDYDDALVDKEYIEEFHHKITAQITHMSNTLDEFRSFFRPNKKTGKFNVKIMIEKVLLLIKDEFQRFNIEVCINNIDDFNLIGIENEFQHLVINILNNAKDAFSQNSVENRRIDINILKDGQLNKIEIIDNAGGIPKAFVQNIFKANYTTKKTGTGVGLYMSKLIADKIGGVLKVANTSDGAIFTFEKLCK